ncbi:hypothetical protein BpHYR1_023028 [Brachionus plicatilis]|uniref:Uncharacterized protein n=1 Tax=Brachionus plicatilis TaxID=10195 RepID=A0A3M7T7L7_BRAPC|nr:hypothetical protein BpHYR1_023028 [Brachionus plicatilis]
MYYFRKKILYVFTLSTKKSSHVLQWCYEPYRISKDELQVFQFYADNPNIKKYEIAINLSKDLHPKLFKLIKFYICYK